MQNKTPDERQTRIFRKALALVRDYGGISSWTRPNGTTRITYKRKLRGIEIEWDRDTRKLPDLTVVHESILRVRLPDAGTVFEARFDGSRADDQAVALTIEQDDPGGWERILFGA